ncbi:SMP-30/gluconolactonase/LRE family protein [Conexibacter arvalis]|uniref:Regucalcin n=1 Tax=Conexibacter arvalis TaxID=912552 RepID=A0A840IFQ5_9ACTN|nr:SMP-30/gluconolactonase/LRE family protein [Conexibacter arvalis]MBB4662818.1 sugar lactone lactonase YvrE [Conexibacter arvalis]
MSAVELLLDARAELAEGPRWDARDGRLVWVDILAGRVHRLDPADGRDTSTEVGEPVGVATPRRGGGLVLAVEHGFALLDDGAAAPVPFAPADAPAGSPPWRFNDGACDPAGRLFAGTMTYDVVPGAARLHRLDPDGSVRPVLDGLTISNGIGFSPDGATCYLVDTPTRRIDAFDYDVDTATLSRRRPLAEIEPGAGDPDGLCVDADGAIWVALWGGSAVRRYAPDGRLLRMVELPAPQVSSCGFGGNDLRTLFVTTARVGMSDEQLAAAPRSGGLFALADAGVAGLPVAEFAG